MIIKAISFSKGDTEDVLVVNRETLEGNHKLLVKVIILMSSLQTLVVIY